MKILKSEKGNTLVIAVFVLVMASVIGLSLISMAMNGTKRNEHRENYSQAVEQAEKGIKHITLDIQKQLEDKINSIEPATKVGSTAPNFDKENWDNILDNYICIENKVSKIHFENEESNLIYDTCIDKIVDDHEDQPKVIKFKSTGTADGETKVLKSTYEIGIIYDNNPAFLNYAVATHSGGNLFLNGGVDIKGDVRADGNIIMTESSYIPLNSKSSNNNPWVENMYARVSGKAAQEAEFLVNPDKKLFVSEGQLSGTGKEKRQPFIINDKDKITQLKLDVLGILALNLALPDFNNLYSYYSAITYPELAHFNFDKYASGYYQKKLEGESLDDYDLFTPHQVSEVNSFLKGDPRIYNTTKMGRVDVSEFVNKGKDELDLSKKYNYNSTYEREFKLIGLIGLWKKPEPLYESYNASSPTDLQYGIYGNELLSKKDPIITGRYMTETPSILHNSSYKLGQGNKNQQGDYIDSFYFKQANLSLLGGSNQLNGHFYFENYEMKINLESLVEYLTKAITGLKLLENLGLDKILEPVISIVTNIVGLVDDIANDVLIRLDIESTSLFIKGGNQTLNGNFYINGIKNDPNALIKLKIGESDGDALKIHGGNHTIKGIYYINGDVEIKDAEIHADAVFYVNGNVLFEDTTIKGATNGKLIVFSTGDISYNYSKNPNENDYVDIDAYFYSTHNIELHGTIHKITIKGGVAANQLFLSGFNGTVDKGPHGNYTFKTKKNMPRLKIIYDEEVVTTYSKYNQPVEYHEYELQPLREISREITKEND